MLVPSAGAPIMTRQAQPSEGITVRGSGSATTMATTATLSLFITTRNNAMTLNNATLTPIVDAGVRSGVPRSDVTLPMYLNSSARFNNATITATVHHPTVTMLQSGIASLSSTLSGSPDLILSNAQVRLSSDDCVSAQHLAQAAALRQARANAETIARQLGVRVGAVLAVDAQNSPTDAQGQCTSGYSLGPYQNMPFTSPDDYLRLRVFASVSIRYAIR